MSAPPHVTPIFARRWACFFGVLYPFGVPAALWYLLHTRRNQQDEFERGWHARLRLVTKSYSEELWWFEVYELLRKCLLCGVLIFIMPETPTQLAVGCLITMAFMVLYSYAQPYEDDADDILQLLCQVAVFTNYFSGLLLMVKSDGATSPAFTKWLVGMNLSPIIYGLCFVLFFLFMPILRMLSKQLACMSERITALQAARAAAKARARDGLDDALDDDDSEVEVEYRH